MFNNCEKIKTFTITTVGKVIAKKKSSEKKQKRKIMANQNIQKEAQFVVSRIVLLDFLIAQFISYTFSRSNSLQVFQERVRVEQEESLSQSKNLLHK